MKAVRFFIILISLVSFSFAQEEEAQEEEAISLSELPREDQLRVQIFLDHKLFGPGYLDGKIGQFTKKAAAAYNSSLGREGDDWSSLLGEARAGVGEVFTEAEVPGFLKEYVHSGLSTRRSEQAQGGFMPYRSWGELMAERYHTSVAYLIELNGKSKVYGAKGGKVLKVPNIQPFLVENLRLSRAYKKKDGLSDRTIIVDTKEKILYLYAPVSVVQSVVLQAASSDAESEDVEGGFTAEVEADGSEPSGQKKEELKGVGEANEQRLIASFPITPGYEKFIHRGKWTMRNCVEFPQWRYDPQLLKTGKRGKEAMQIPGGPNNPVGVVWAGLSKSGIGIHGTSSPETIGRSRSAGCIRLANWDAAKLPYLARPGSTVIIR